jgi:hypothetical protein
VPLDDLYDVDDMARIERWRPSDRRLAHGGWRAKGAAGAVAACLTFGIPAPPASPHREPAPIVRVVEPDDDAEWLRRLLHAGAA